MNTIQIYDLDIENDDIQILIDKLKSAGADINRYDVGSESDKLNENNKIKRLFSAYGRDIFPITMVNGEIVEVEKNLEAEQIIRQLDIPIKKIANAGIEIKNNLCNNNSKCGGCGCSKSNCSSCDNKKQCCQNKN